MSRLSWAPLTVAHVMGLELSLPFAGFGPTRRLPGAAEILAEWGWAGRRDDRLLVIGGVMPQWEGRALVWMAAGDLCPRDYPEITARAIEMYDDAHAAGYARLEAHVVADWRGGARWIRRLGFEFEGTMRRFLQGRDYDLYSRVRVVRRREVA